MLEPFTRRGQDKQTYWFHFFQNCLKRKKWEVCKWNCSQKGFLHTNVTFFYLVRWFIKLFKYLSMWTLLKKREDSVSSSLGCCYCINFVSSAYVGENIHLSHISLHMPISERRRKTDLYLNRKKSSSIIMQENSVGPPLVRV